jgi:hypothetical protein
MKPEKLSAAVCYGPVGSKATGLKVDLPKSTDLEPPLAGNRGEVNLIREHSHTRTIPVPSPQTQGTFLQLPGTDRRWVPALTYLAPSLSGALPYPDYGDRFTAPARAYGFPEWYSQHIDSIKQLT